MATLFYPKLSLEYEPRLRVFSDNRSLLIFGFSLVKHNLIKILLRDDCSRHPSCVFTHSRLGNTALNDSKFLKNLELEYLL